MNSPGIHEDCDTVPISSADTSLPVWVTILSSQLMMYNCVTRHVTMYYKPRQTCLEH